MHNPVHYVQWLGTQKKRLVVLAKEQGGEVQRYGPGEEGGLRGSLRTDAARHELHHES